MNIRRLPENEKPREKLMREGKEKLSTTEIIAILIGSGTGGKSALELASEVISMDSSGIRFLAECRPEELIKIKGIGRAKACEILAAVELGRRIAAIPKIDNVRIDAVRRSAGSVIFIHNHPSGDPTPSSADIETTRRLIESGDILGIPVLDHIVIGDGCYISMRAQGMI